jgi:hypothetical protein
MTWVTLQTKVKLEAIFENGRIFGRGKLWLIKNIFFLKNSKLTVINVVKLG